MEIFWFSIWLIWLLNWSNKVKYITSVHAWTFLIVWTKSLIDYPRKWLLDLSIIKIWRPYSALGLIVHRLKELTGLHWLNLTKNHFRWQMNWLTLCKLHTCANQHSEEEPAAQLTDSDEDDHNDVDLGGVACCVRKGRLNCPKSPQNERTHFECSCSYTHKHKLF